MTFSLLSTVLPKKKEQEPFPLPITQLLASPCVEGKGWRKDPNIVPKCGACLAGGGSRDRPWRLRAATLQRWRAHREGVQGMLADESEQCILTCGRGHPSHKEASVLRCWRIGNGASGLPLTSARGCNGLACSPFMFCCMVRTSILTLGRYHSRNPPDNVPAH